MPLPKRDADRRPPELRAGQKLGDQFMVKIIRDKYGVFESAFAAQVILTHAKATMGAGNAEAWNCFINDLLKELRFQ